MRVLIQRVSQAECQVDGKIISKIKHGLLVFIGVSQTDNSNNVSKMCEKIKKLRIFEDKAGQTNLSLTDVQGEIMAISQFTLYADVANSNRPSFVNTLDFKAANLLYLETVELLSKEFKTVAGSFGADMQITLTNSGPFTLILEN